MMKGGMVSRIQRFSTEDGPGIRTTVFLKGCNLHCAWCHNPETWSSSPQVLFYAGRCTNCGRCAAVCPAGAHTVTEGRRRFERERCLHCGRCVEACPSEALQREGQVMEAEDVLRILDEDVDFYRASGGGVTLSGGEPLLQPEFCASVAAGCRKRNISVIVDTAGDVPFAAFQRLLSFVDIWYVDLKGAVPENVVRYTGADLTHVLDNMTRLTAAGAAVTARVPVIPNYNDTEEIGRAMAVLLRQAGVTQAALLPFHRLGTAKYQALGYPYPYAGVLPPSKETMKGLERIFNELGVACENRGV